MSELLMKEIAKKLVETAEICEREMKPAMPEALKAKSVLPMRSQLLDQRIAVHLDEQREIQAAEQKMLEARKWLEGKEINPHYLEHSDYSINCGSCAFALWRRLNGEDPDAKATRRNIAPTIESMELLTGLKYERSSPEKIEQLLRARGPSSHLIVCITRSRGNGHWFNAGFDGKRVYNMDAQIGKMEPWPRDYGDVISWGILT